MKFRRLVNGPLYCKVSLVVPLSFRARMTHNSFSLPRHTLNRPHLIRSTLNQDLQIFHGVAILLLKSAERLVKGHRMSSKKDFRLAHGTLKLTHLHSADRIVC